MKILNLGSTTCTCFAGILAFILFTPGLARAVGTPPSIAQVFRPGLGAQEGQGVAVSSAGNIYVTGQFQGTATFGNLSLTNGGATDYYLSAHSPTGGVLWAVGAGGAGSDIGSDVIVDRSGNIVVAGVIQGTNDFHGFTNTLGFGKKDFFLAKYSPAGALLWVRLAGSTGDDQAYDVAEDGAGNYYLGGRISGLATFGSTTIGAASQNRLVLAKYSSDGQLAWVRDVGGTGSTETCGVAADAAGNAYITGLSTSPGGPFVAKYTSNGTREWIHVANTGFTFFEEGSSVDVDAAGNVYVGGRFSATNITFGTTTLTNPAGAATGYLAKFDATGKPLWAKLAGARAFDVDVTPDGTVYTAGFYGTTARTLGPETLPQPIGGLEVFVALFSTDGVVEWFRGAGTSGNDIGRAITKAPNGSIFAVGEGGSELFDVASYPGGVFVSEFAESSAATPRLSLSLSSGTLTISWPATLSGYNIETAGALNSPFVVPQVVLSAVPGLSNAFSLPLPSSNLFFRLKK